MLLAVFAMMPVMARAADDDEVKPDARLQGYPSPVYIDSGSGTTYLFFVVLTMATAGVMFMNAKRTHLD
jgi:hypothetical protein